MNNPTSSTMRSVRVEKITLNYGAGKDRSKLDKGMSLLKYISGLNPVKTVTNKRNQDWGLRPGLPIGCKATLRKLRAESLLKNLLSAKENQLSKKQFDESGNVSFGIHEYIDVPGLKYDPNIGIMGFDVCITLERPGYRIKKRKIQNRKIPPRHKISREDAMEFMKSKFNVKVEE